MATATDEGFVAGLRALITPIFSSDRGLYYILSNEVAPLFLDAADTKGRLASLANSSDNEIRVKAAELLEFWSRQ